MEPQQPPFPRPPGDEERLRRLRQEAVERMEREDLRGAEPWPSPQPKLTAPAYGGPAMITRRWTVRGILMLIGGALAAIAAALLGYRRVSVPVHGRPPAPVYGGPPAPQPQPPVGGSSSAPAYGGPPPQPQPPVRRPAPAYGGPPPQQQPPAGRSQ